jgi:hypothetical protein
MTYDLSRGDAMLGTGVETYVSDGKTYSITSEAKGKGVYGLLFGSIKRESRGAVTSQGLKPTTFADVRNDKTYASAQFDWNKMALALRYRNKNKTVPLVAGAHDQLSFAYSFAFEQKLPGQLDVRVTNGKRLSLYRYENLGRETITTPLGTLETVHLKRDTEPGKSGSEIWLSPAHRNLPVKVVIIDDDDGSRFEQTVTSIEFNQGTFDQVPHGSRFDENGLATREAGQRQGSGCLGVRAAKDQ